MSIFGIVLSSVFTLVHSYVFWRVASVPFVRRYVPGKFIIGAAVLLWLIFLLSRTIGHGGSGLPVRLLEHAGMNWLGVVLLLFVCLLAVDLITVFGFLAPRLAPSLRGWALVLAAALSMIAVYQGYRAPAIRAYEVTLPGLPAEMDGAVIVGVSDTHLGSLLGETWLAGRIEQVRAQKPDLVFLIGDIFEGYKASGDALVAALQELSAPLGVWCVPGNHEMYRRGAGLKQMEKTGFRILRNRWVELKPGFILAGVDDLTFARRNGQKGASVSKVLDQRPPGATILLSHTPWQMEEAAHAGVDLMLSGHTHGGQIWPFGYLVRLAYPLIGGRHDISGMPLIICRGTGTWGPHMRLWRPGEILRITLRSR